MEVVNALSADISGPQGTMCFITELDKGVLLRTEKTFIPVYVQQEYQIITESLKTYHSFS